MSENGEEQSDDIVDIVDKKRLEVYYMELVWLH